MKNKFFIVVVTITHSIFSFAQLKDITGIILANNNLEGIHILNKTALKYTVTDTDGSFTIPVQLNDTLTVSGLAYKIKTVVVTKSILKNNTIEIYLDEEITELDDVFVGRLLTGNLNSDFKNTETEESINFYDLGIPGYIGKPKTLNERKLYEAKTGGGLLPLNPILNLITGRKKQLEKRVQLDKKIKCTNHFKAAYKTIIFEGQHISELQQSNFFDFILDSEELKAVCKADNAMAQIDFLNKELKLFKIRRKENDN